MGYWGLGVYGFNSLAIASALGQICAAQRKLVAPTRKAGGRAGSSSSSKGGSSLLEDPVKIESLNGQWVMKGFEADKQQGRRANGVAGVYRSNCIASGQGAGWARPGRGVLGNLTGETFASGR
jgi:hypothetical protein